ncbi:MAG: hypothetical protein RIG62_25720 [Cyclobacteriaceae bacterium]
MVAAAGTTHDLIHTQQEMAEMTARQLNTSGVLAWVSFFFLQKTFNRPARILTIITFAMGVIVLNSCFEWAVAAVKMRHTRLLKAVQ